MYGHENEKSVNVLLEGQTMEMRRSIIWGSFLIFDTPILLYLVQWGLVFMNGFLLVRIAQFLQVSEHTFMMNCRLSSTKYFSSDANVFGPHTASYEELSKNWANVLLISELDH